MQTDARTARAAQIEKIAFQIIAEKGFLNMSMLTVAKAAKASNETLYRWYGDKNGLFKALVERNTQSVSDALTKASAKQMAPLDSLDQVGPVLLAMVLDVKAVSLNQAAASDPSGALGQALAAAGRETVFPMIRKLCAEAIKQHSLGKADPSEIAQAYITLLIGDLQIRRAINVLEPLSQAQIDSRARHALSCLKTLYPPHLDAAGTKA